MLTYQPASPEQYDEFLQLMQEETAEYIDTTLALMQMSLEQFKHLLRTRGNVYGIYQDNQLVGYYWIEERGDILHLHGLILKEGFRGKGIGTEVLQMLADRYAGQMAAIELGVHESNARARSLYERMGYRTVKHLVDLGFYIMQYPLSA
jgi:ribosomal protein S18 acetylase RimI-like enzyme